MYVCIGHRTRTAALSVQQPKCNHAIADYNWYICSIRTYSCICVVHGMARVRNWTWLFSPAERARFAMPISIYATYISIHPSIRHIYTYYIYIYVQIVHTKCKRVSRCFACLFFFFFLLAHSLGVAFILSFVWLSFVSFARVRRSFRSTRHCVVYTNTTIHTNHSTYRFSYLLLLSLSAFLIVSPVRCREAFRRFSSIKNKNLINNNRITERDFHCWKCCVYFGYKENREFFLPCVCLIFPYISFLILSFPRSLDFWFGKKYKIEIFLNENIIRFASISVILLALFCCVNQIKSKKKIYQNGVLCVSRSIKKKLLIALSMVCCSLCNH